MTPHRPATAALLESLLRGLESRPGRTVFWAWVVCFGLVLGAYTVVRAEVPKRLHVGRLRYASPVEIGRNDPQADYHSSEFRGFRALSWGSVVEGLDQYVDLHTRGYPPFFAIAFFPFALPWRWPGLGSALFFLAGYVAALISAWALAGLCAEPGERPRFGLLALNWLLIAPFAAAVLARCETDMLVLLPLALALSWLARGRRRFAAGGLLGFAASFKVFPALFGVYLLCRARWRALAGMATVGILCTVALPLLVWGPRRATQLHASWVRHVVAPYGVSGARGVIGRPFRSTNQSLTAAVHRFLTPIRAGKGSDMRRVNFARLSPASADRLALVLRVLIACGLFALWLLARAPSEAGWAQRAVLLGTVPLGMLLIGDPSLSTHHVVLVLPMSVIIARASCLKDGAAQRWLWTVAAAGVLCLLGGSPTVRLCSPFLWATLLLLAATVGLARHDWRRHPTPCPA